MLKGSVNPSSGRSCRPPAPFPKARILTRLAHGLGFSLGVSDVR